MEKYIQEKYKSYNLKEIQSGYRCKTYLLSNDKEKLIYQIYFDNTKYQAKKKKEIIDIIKNNTDISQIPNIIEYNENHEYAYLITEFKKGTEMENILTQGFDYKIFYKQLASLLSKIHKIDIGNRFGWIGANGLEKNEFFSNYIEKEVSRNITRIKEIIKNEKPIVNNIQNKAKSAEQKVENIKNIKPVLSWYDINSNNILVNDKSEITGFLDPGGARFAAKEWDLAFIKMDLCKSREEYEYFINEYRKYSNVNEELLNALCIIVEIDDIAFQLETKTKLPIAFESNFKKDIKMIQEMW